MKVEVEVSDQFLQSQIQNAGVNYWAKEGYCHLSVDDWISVQDDLVYAQEDLGKRFHLDWKRAIQIAVRDYPRILDEHWADSNTGDIWIQLAAFGELRYG